MTVKKIAPNQGTRNETAEVMGVRRKGAKKRLNPDPYCGGESSGKVARADARTSKKPRLTQAAEPPSSLGSPNDSEPAYQTSSVGADAELFDGFQDLAPDGSLPQAATTEESPEMLLRQALGLYNVAFPPDVPRGTTYYRNNTYITSTATRSYYR